MTDPAESADSRDPAAMKDALLDAILPLVAFEGWSEQAFRDAAAQAQLAPELARMVCPRGAVDLALALHARGDAAMLARLQAEDLSALRFRDRIAAAVRFRLEAIAEDKEAVRRAAALFALPRHAADGARAVWTTADLIWTALGDSADDINWYTKRLTLAGLHSATLLYWLGDASPGHRATWDFLDRRIDEVMRFEKTKAAMRDNALFRTVFAGPLWALGQVRAPSREPAPDLPGTMTRHARR
jgi:ubiquinone biosynthesis protein COQ9